MERRAFIKHGCTACLLITAGIMLPTVSSAGNKRKVYKTELNENKDAEIPLEIFNEGNLQIVRIKRWYYDIAVHKEEDGTYSAFLMKCTHMDNQLEITGNGFVCDKHGSEFDKTGAVTNGPAERSLKKYPTTIKETTLLITIGNDAEENE
ncbi:MAG: Rieske (2Fe-2S) protein [Bacteroidetes bacterium]|nr:Rieske (2Fe-2S) protein [Bacteroidota bacterium]